MEKPNILLLVVDSLRADRFHENLLPPNLKSLIKSGVHFETGISSAASTILGISSLLTGQFPFRIGLGDNKFRKLDPKVDTFPRYLKQMGYDLHATVPKIATEFGLTYDVKNINKEYGNYFSLFDGLGDEILGKFKNNEFESPWFFYIHIFDLHTPITVPKIYNKPEFGESNYDKMIYAIDDWIGKFMKEINFDNTVIIITSDHGEYVPILKTENGIINLESSSTEKKLWAAGSKIPNKFKPIKLRISKALRKTRKTIKSLKIDPEKLTPYQKRILFSSRMEQGHRMFDDLLKIPILFIGPNIPKNKKISRLIRQVDIFPTIFDILNFDYPKIIDGVSTKSLILDDELLEQNFYIESPPSREMNSIKYFGLRTTDYKFIQDESGNPEKFELYHLKTDPLEEKNIAKLEPALVKDFQNNLKLLRKNLSKTSNNFSESEQEQVENILKKLGYT